MKLSFPKPVWVYLKGLLILVESANCVSLVRSQKGASHDSLTRMLKNRKLDWQTLLSSFILALAGKLSQGHLIIDDTVIDKTFARLIEGVAWVYCSKKQRSIQGLSIVVLAWSNGKMTIPLALKLWQKERGKSKVDLARELIRWAKRLPNFKPKYVVFDSWYAASRLCKLIESFGWTWVSQLKKNRKLNGIPLTSYQRNPYWIADGSLSGGHKVLVVRHGKKYFATSNRRWSKQDILNAYRSRWPIETMFRVVHSQLGIGQCQSRSAQSQISHFHLCFMTYSLLEHERYFNQQTIYETRRHYRLNPDLAENLLNKLIFQSA